MAISKLILNGETQMDVTSNTNTSNNMLSGVVGTKNDGTSVTGSIATKTSSDLIASGATVTAPAGYYANAASKAVATVTHPNPTASIASSTGVVTASHTQGTGYVTGGTTTGTLNLTTQAGKTVTPTETAQTAVASYRWTTGPISVAAIDSYYIGSRVPQNSAADVTIANTTGVVTAPAGYYSTAATKTLTTKAGETFYPSTADQTISSYRWLIGNQTIASVTTTNLVAQNIAEGVVVKVGDANNASRITQVTGTHSGATSYTATISGSGGNGRSVCYVQHNNETTKYYTNGDTIIFKEGDTFTFTVDEYPTGGGSIYLNDELITTKTGNTVTYTWTAPVGNINIILDVSRGSIRINTLVMPTGVTALSSAGTHNVYSYSQATIAEGSAFPPATTITQAPLFNISSSTGMITASYTGSSSITPTVISGWISQGTSGVISTTGTNIYQLPTQSATTYYPSTADQIISSYRWLTGAQTIKSVTTTGGEYYNAYKTIALKSSIYSSNTDIVSYFSTISSITPYQFEDICMSGSFTFPVCTTIGDGGFQHTGYNHCLFCAFDFPEVVSIGLFAFKLQSRLTSINAPKATIIKTQAFMSCTSLQTVNFPKVTGIGDSAFFDCKALTTVSFPEASYIYTSAFNGCQNLSSISFPKISQIGIYAFARCYSLTTADFPSTTSIGAYAFQSCSNLITANFPSATSIGQLAFYGCSNLSSISFPNTTYIGSSTFYNCTKLIEASFPKLSEIERNAFGYCSSLTTANFTSVTLVSVGGFNNCINLTTISFPELLTIQQSAFAYCSALTTVDFPKATIVGYSAFHCCTNLTTASFPNVVSIATSAFYSCYHLLSLYLLGSSIVSLAGSGAFLHTPISTYTTSTGGVYGSIFVPASLYSSYLTATNWSYYSSRFVSV